MQLLDIVKKGSTDRSVTIRIIDSTTGLPETAVEHNTSGIDLWYRREGADKSSITEAALSALADAHSDGGIEHIGDGYYRLDLPDAAFATGANHVDIGGTVTDMIVVGGRVRLVNYDPEDTVRFGLTALPNAAADDAGGLVISDAGGLDIDSKLAVATSSLATPTNITAGTITTVTNLTNAPTSGDLTATMKASVTTAATAATPIAASVASYGSLISDIALAVWSTGSRTLTAISDSSGITTLLSRIIGTLASGTHNAQSGDSFARLGSPSGASVSADIAAISVGSGGLDAAGVRAAIGLASANLDTQLDAIPTVGEIQSGLATAASLATVAGYLDTEIAAILADTNELQTDWANGGRLDSILDTAALGGSGGLDAAGVRAAIGLASANLDTQLAALPTAAENADAVWDEATSGHTSAGSYGASVIIIGVEYVHTNDTTAETANVTITKA